VLPWAPLYLASHASRIIDWPIPEGRLLLHDLIEHATRPEFVYRHSWRVGDLVIGLAARSSPSPAVTMTSTPARTRAAARAGKRSGCPCADRTSSTRLSPCPARLLRFNMDRGHDHTGDHRSDEPPPLNHSMI
jgi:hypothetical protein